MKDYKTPGTLPVEDKKCFFGKFSSGKESQLEKKEVCTSFIRLRNSLKKKFRKTSYKRKSSLVDLRSTKHKSLSTCTWISITTINRTLQSRTSLMFVDKKHLKSPTKKD